MRHLSDVTSIEELIYSDAFTIQAYDEFGNMMWHRRFPSMLMQSYYANNSTFVLIRNTRSMHAGGTTNLDGVRLLDYSQQVEDHVLLASLDPPHSTSDLPLLGPLYPSREEMGVIPSKGNTDLVEPQEVSHGVVALKDWTYREGVRPFASVPLNPLSPLNHLLIFLITLLFVILVLMVYRYFLWFAPNDEKEVTPSVRNTSLANYPFSTSTIHEIDESETPSVHLPPVPEDPNSSSASIPVDSTDFSHIHQHSPKPGLTMATLPNSTDVLTTSDLSGLHHISLMGVNLPLCTGRYRQDFTVILVSFSYL